MTKVTIGYRNSAGVWTRDVSKFLLIQLVTMVNSQIHQMYIYNNLAHKFMGATNLGRNLSMSRRVEPSRSRGLARSGLIFPFPP